MTKHVSNLTTPIGEILQSAPSHGMVLETDDHAQYAVMPLDDEVLDFLLERNPRFIKECQEIYKRMKEGRFRTHDEVLKMFGLDKRKGSKKAARKVEFKRKARSNGVHRAASTKR